MKTNVNVELFEKEINKLGLGAYGKLADNTDIVFHRHDKGYLCGYVRLPESLNLTLQEAEDLFVVHGGISYLGTLPIYDSETLYVGFDCAHLNDYIPFGDYHLSTEEYRTLEYVKDEALNLYNQVNSLAERVS